MSNEYSCNGSQLQVEGVRNFGDQVGRAADRRFTHPLTIH